MQVQQRVFRRRRNNNVQIDASEHYLRDDIVCVCSTCKICPFTEDDKRTIPCSLPATSQNENSPISILKKHLEEKVNSDTMSDEECNFSLKESYNSLLKFDDNTPLIVIPDMSTFMSQMDLLETHTSPFANIIVLQSLLNDVSRRHYKTYQRIRALINLGQFQAATSLPSNFEGSAQSAGLGEELPIIPSAQVFPDLYHRDIYTEASNLVESPESAFRKNFVNSMNKLKEEQYLIGNDNEDSDDSDDDGYNTFRKMKSLIQPITKVIDVTSSTAALDLQAKIEKQKTGQLGDDSDLRSNNLVFSAARWLQLHVGSDACVVLLTNDETTARSACEMKVTSLCVDNYVEAYTEKYPALSRVMAKIVKDQLGRDRAQWIYEPHLTMSQMKLGVERAEYQKGIFDVNRDYWTEATVMTNAYGRVLIPDLKSMNRAVHGDSVVVKLLPKEQWQSASTGLMSSTPETTTLDSEEREAEDVLVNDDEGTSKLSNDYQPEKQVLNDDSKIMPTGVIVGIWERNFKSMCGSLELTDKKDGSALFLPVNRRYPKVLIESRQINDLVDKRVIVTIDQWPAHSKLPYGHLVRSLGVIGDKTTETEVLLLEHEIRHDKWSAAVEACLPPPDYEISEEELAGRVDLRDVNICSIDPPGCTDIDDALHCIDLGDGTYEVGVHIADVTHYVKPGSALDQEAAARSTSVYLTDRRIDMIPARLSTNLCSLRSNVDRLAFSTIWRMNDKAEILETKFFKSVISSKAELMYSEAQERIDKVEEDNDPITHACKNLMMIARKIKQKRIDDGALSLASSEVRFKLSDDRSTPLEIGMYQLKEANSLVEEFMLLANVSVAKHILRTYPTMALLRRHPTPAPEMLEPLVKAAKSWGYDIDISSGKTLSDSLDAIVDPKYPMFNKVVRMMTTRCMTKAVYMSSGEVNEKAFSHFGLACNTYTHFTSPIRRYSDIIVHRLLATSLGICSLPDMIKDKAHMRDVVDNLNYRHNMAQLASRASTEVWTVMYFTGRDEIAEAVVLAVRSTGIRVLIPDYGIECAIKLVPSCDKNEVFIVPSGDDGQRYVGQKKYIYDPQNVCIYIGNLKYKIWERFPVRVCVKENKMRRRWLHVEFTGEKLEHLYEQCPSLKNETELGTIVKSKDIMNLPLHEDEEENEDNKLTKKRKITKKKSIN